MLLKKKEIFCSKINSKEQWGLVKKDVFTANNKVINQQRGDRHKRAFRMCDSTVQ